MDPMFDKTVLVTGGTGSLGKTLVRRILSGEYGRPRKVIVLSRDEAKQHEMRLEYLNASERTDEVIFENFRRLLEFRIGDVRDFRDLSRALHGVQIVINAAALKQVPTCEYFPDQAIYTNCLGASNVVRAVLDSPTTVETVVGISTDKACKPINAMGMTKALQERIFIAANLHSSNTRFVLVRYGNVVASRGSVIPLFMQQAASGGPLTVTHADMTRFLITLDQAVDLVIDAIRDGRAGEILIPACPSALVWNIAQAIAENARLTIVQSGIRPGEKMHEILVSEEESSRASSRGERLVIRPMLPELEAETDGRRPQFIDEQRGRANEYSSADAPMSYDDTRLYLQSLGITPRMASSPEFLR